MVVTTVIIVILLVLLPVAYAMGKHNQWESDARDSMHKRH
jgi:hypothetical protein